MTTKELNQKLKEIKALQEFIDNKCEELEVMKNEVKDYLTSEGLSEMITDDYIVRFTSVSSKRVNTSILQNMYPEIYENVRTLTESKRFTINELEKGCDVGE